MGEMKEAIVFEIMDEDPYENVFDSKGSQILAMRNVSWNGNEPKLELRKWNSKDDGDFPMKGFSFLTEEGPDNLAEVLIRNGYGDTATLLDLLMEREESSDISVDDKSTSMEDKFKSLVDK